MWQQLTPLRIALLLGLSLATLRLSGCQYLELADIRTMDYRLLQRGIQEATSEVVVIAIDNGSLEKHGRWPWPRSRLAQLLDRLVEAEAAVIGFDIVQSEPTVVSGLDNFVDQVGGLDEAARVVLRQALDIGVTEDQILVAAVRVSRRTVLGYFFDDFDQQATDGGRPTLTSYNLVQHSRDQKGEHQVPMAATATFNLRDLTDAAQETGFFNFIFDADGLYRRAPMAIYFGDQVAVPLSLAMLRVYWPEKPLAIRFAEFGVESVRVGSLSIPVSEDGQLLVNYRGPSNTFRHVSAADVLAGRVAPEILRGKLALVGVTATAVGDVRATPFDGVLPGVEIHANVLDNILRQDFISRPRIVVIAEVAIILVSVLLLGVVLHYLRGALAALTAIALLGVYLIASQWAFLWSGVPLSFIYPLLSISLTYTAISLQHFVLEEREKRKMRRSLELYLSPTLARMISDRPETLKLGGEKREHTVLFSDIRGFTTISEQLDPEVLVELLNAYLGEMTEIIFSHDGMLDKYIGDAVMAVWSAPLPQRDHAARACRAALAMLARLRTLEHDWRQRGWPKLDIGIGLNSGPMIFGNMGSAEHLSLTVMGDEVNLGSRLEGLNKLYGSHIIASEATLRNAEREVVARELDLVRVKGKLQPVRIFEVLGPSSERDQWTPVLERFGAGLCAYRQRRWHEALAAFEAVLKERPDDGVADLYLRRCRDMEQNPPSADWDGVTVMESK